MVGLTTWKTTVPDILQDQKHTTGIFLRVLPAEGTGSSRCVPGCDRLLIALDQYQSPYFRSTTTFHGFNARFRNEYFSDRRGCSAAIFNGLAKKIPTRKARPCWPARRLRIRKLREVLKLSTRRARLRAFSCGAISRTRAGFSHHHAGGFPSGHTIGPFRAQPSCRNAMGMIVWFHTSPTGSRA